MAGPFSPRVRRTLVVLPFAVYALMCVTSWLEPEWRPGPDAGMYVLTAQSLARGDGFAYLDRAIWWTPGLPWLVAWTMPGGEFRAPAANQLMMWFAAAMPIAIALALRRRHGTAMAAAAALLAATSPLWVGRFNFVATEFPFMVALFAGLAAAERANTEERHRVFAAVTAGLLLAASAMVRSVALVAIPGVLLAGWFRSPPDRRWAGLLPGGLALALSLPWMVYSAMLNRKLGPWDQALVHDYTTAVFRVDPNDPSSELLGPLQWIERGSSNLSDIASIFGQSIDGTSAGASIVGAILIALAATGLVLTLRRGAGVVDWFALAYGGVTAIYFTTTGRLLAPALPLMFVYLLVAVDAAWRRATQGGDATGRRSRGWAVVAALLVAGHLLQLPQALHPEHGPSGESQVGRTWRTYRAVGAWLRENTTEDAVLLCGPASIYSVLSERRAYTYNYASVRDLVPRYQPNYVLVPKRSVSRGGRDVEWLENQALESWTVEATGASARAIQIYRLRPASDSPPNTSSSTGSSTLSIASISLR